MSSSPAADRYFARKLAQLLAARVLKSHRGMVDSAARTAEPDIPHGRVMHEFDAIIKRLRRQGSVGGMDAGPETTAR